MKLFTVEDAFKRTKVKPRTWRAWILQRKIKVVRIGRTVRIPESEIRRLIAEGTTPATPASTLYASTTHKWS